MQPRFLLDEHVNPAVQRQLQRRSLELVVLRVGEIGAPPKGTPDADLLAWAEVERFVLVSEDRSTLPDCLRARLDSGGHSYGILWIRPGTTVGHLIEELFPIWQVCEVDEFRDRGIYIPL